MYVGQKLYFGEKQYFSQCLTIVAIYSRIISHLIQRKWFLNLNRMFIHLPYVYCVTALNSLSGLAGM